MLFLLPKHIQLHRIYRLLYNAQHNVSTTTSFNCRFEKNNLANSLTQKADKILRTGTILEKRRKDCLPSCKYMQNQSHTFALNASCLRKVRRFSTSADSSNETDKETALMAEEIISATKKSDIMVESIPESIITQLINDLTKIKLDPKDILDLLSGKTWLLRDGHVIVPICDTLKQHGLNKKTAFSLFNNLPYEYLSDRQLLRGLPNRISNSLLQLRQANVFTEEVLEEVIIKAPTVLFMDIQTVMLRHANLSDLFSAKDSLEIILKCPHLLVQDFDEIHELFEYVYNVMKYGQLQMVQSHMFSHSLDHIRDRHLFVLRAGHFEQLKKQLMEDEPNPNPPLSDVVDSSVEEFVHLCGISDPDEYAAFEGLRELEKDQERKEEAGESSDEDGDREEEKMFPKKRQSKAKKKKNNRVKNRYESS